MPAKQTKASATKPAAKKTVKTKAVSAKPKASIKTAKTTRKSTKTLTQTPVAPPVVAVESTPSGTSGALGKLRSRLSRSSWRKLGLGGLIVLLAILAVFFGFQYKQSQDDVARLSNPEESAQAEIAEITEHISEIVTLPDETPSLATVNDPGKLRDQTFFLQAAKGDKVLIYTEAKRAVLYRPSTEKVVEVSSVTITRNGDTGNSNSAIDPAQNTTQDVNQSNTPQLKP